MFIQTFPVISPLLFACVVVILGFLTPGYNHINHTISRLAIEKYGWIQSLNFLQLAAGVTLLGNTLSKSLKTSSSRVAARTIFFLCGLFLTVAALAPTDPIENVPLRLSLYTPVGLVHAGAVILFLVSSPLGIRRLARILASEPHYKMYSTLTTVIGYACFVASIAWFLFFVLGIGLGYRGIFQKMIAVPVIFWFTLMGVATRKQRNV